MSLFSLSEKELDLKLRTLIHSPGPGDLDLGD